ncbi:hypothetical protein PA598K_03243 [Paenibacillus sp. 598K]|uniref:Rieske (2Fe-2S) protein n=1 Tax=Paenibacillus sp. 598K TaxID=1117987 RepID=UPI000FFAF066|nr:Rieske (2Fe-2S) protein [Paenibacillus sp. 598K]GBF74874.1 hypothetical protein PA598K_03243 [Paenibacillus sp. 598K]
MKKHIVCREEEMNPGSKRCVEVGKRAFVLVRTPDGSYQALRDVCPHQGARLSDGELTGTNLPSCVGEYDYGRKGEILRCPWHRWEFDVTSGDALVADRQSRVKHYEVTVEDGYVVLHC